MIARIAIVWLLAVVEWYVLRSGLFTRCGILQHNSDRLQVGNSARQMSLNASPRGPIALWEDAAV